MFEIGFTGTMLLAYLVSLLFVVRLRRAYRQAVHDCEEVASRLDRAFDGWANTNEDVERLETRLEASYILLKQARTLLASMHPSHMKKSVQCDIADWNDAVKDVLGDGRKEDGSGDVAVVEEVQATQSTV